MIETERNTRLDGAFTPAHVPGVVAVEAEGEAVLVDERSDQLHVLNGSAALLWQCFDGSASVVDICFDLADGLGVPFEQVLADTLGVVGQLVEKDAVFDARREGAAAVVGRADQDLEVPRRPRLLEEPPAG